MRTVALDAYDHARVPFETVVRELAPDRTVDRTPVFQAFAEFQRAEPFRFDLPGIGPPPGRRPGQVAHGPDRGLHRPAARHPLPFGVQHRPVRPAHRRPVLRGFPDLLIAASTPPEAPLSRLAATAVDTAAEGDPVPRSWQHGPSRPSADTTVHALFARRAAAAAEQHGDVLGGNSRLTYGELDERAERLAAALQARQRRAATRRRTVALWLPRSADLVVAMLAVLKTGHAYVPLDPGLGRARAEQVIAECGPGRWCRRAKRRRPWSCPGT